MGEAKRRRTTGSPASPAIESDELVARGKRLQHAKSHADALALYRRALSLRPDHAEATHLSGLALIEIGQFDLGMDRLRQSLMLDERNALFHFNLGRAHVLSGDATAALDCFDRAVLIEPGYAAAHFQRAGIFESLGQAERSADAFMLAAAAAPTHALAHAGAARQLYRLDRLSEAMERQRRAAAIEPQVLDDGIIGFARARPEAAPQVDARRLASARQCRTVPADESLQTLLPLVTACELVVVDDFLADPMSHRQLAMALPFNDQCHHQGANFPGLQTGGGHMPAQVEQRIADLLARDLKWSWPSHGAFRISTAGSMARSDIHVDHGDDRVALAGVLYLTLPEHCQGGTSFWRHRETGWLRAPSGDEVRQSRYGSFAEFMRQAAPGDSAAFSQLAQKRDQWQLVFEVPMRFNRLIVYRSDYFHAISDVFGSGLADGRLTQLFFFEPLGAAS